MQSNFFLLLKMSVVDHHQLILNLFVTLLPAYYTKKKLYANYRLFFVGQEISNRKSWRASKSFKHRHHSARKLPVKVLGDPEIVFNF